MFSNNPLTLGNKTSLEPLARFSSAFTICHLLLYWIPMTSTENITERCFVSESHGRSDITVQNHIHRFIGEFYVLVKRCDKYS